MNIVSIIMQFLAPALVKRLATSLGLSESIAQKIISVALPVILSGLIGRASQPQGAKALTDLVGKQDPGLLGSLAGMIGGPKQSSLAEQGIGALGSLLGGGALSSLTGALGKFTGADDTATKGMLGMLGPVVLGQLGQQQKSAGLDGAGLVNMLMGQKQNVAAAIPADFAKLLGGSGLLDAVSSQMAPAAAAPLARAPQAPAKSSFGWLPMALAAVAAAFLLWWFVLGGSKPTTTALPAAPRISLDNVDVGGQLGSLLGGLRGDLGSIKDAAGARTALPKLQAAAGELQRLNGVAGRLPAGAKKQLADYVTASLPALTPLIASVLKVPGLEAILKPVLDQVVARLQALGKA